MCKICNKSYNIQSCLQRHLEIKHSNKEGWKFSCEEYERRFTNITDLKRHLPSHKDLRPFRCDVCGNTYKYKSNPREHITSHVTLKCDLCLKEFKRQGSFQSIFPRTKRLNEFISKQQISIDATYIILRKSSICP